MAEPTDLDKTLQEFLNRGLTLDMLEQEDTRREQVRVASEAQAQGVNLNVLNKHLMDTAESWPFSNPRVATAIRGAQFGREATDQDRAMLSTGQRLIMASTPAEQSTIIKNDFPDAEFMINGSGSLVAVLDGKSYNIDPEGFGEKEAAQAAVYGIMFTPAARAASAVKVGIGWLNALPRAGAASLASGGTEYARQEIVDFLGADRPTGITEDEWADARQIATTMAFGFAGELVAPVAGALQNFVRNSIFWKKTKDGVRVLRDKGREYLKKLGIDPDIVDGDESFWEVFRKSPEANPTERALRESRPDIAARIDVAGQASPKGAAFDKSLKAYESSRNQAIIDADAFYKTPIGISGHIPKEASQGVLKHIKTTMDVSKGPEKALMKQLQGRFGFGREPTLKTYVTWRQNVDNMIRSQKDPRQLMLLREAADDAMGTVIERGLAKSTKPGEFAETLNKLVDKEQLMERFNDVDTVFESIRQNQYTPEEVVDLVFGASVVNPQAAKNITHLKNVLGETSDEFKAVKEEGLRVIFQHTPGRTFMNTMYDNHPEFVKALFSKEDILRIKGAVQESGTSNSAVAQFINNSTFIGGGFDARLIGRAVARMVGFESSRQQATPLLHRLVTAEAAGFGSVEGHQFSNELEQAATNIPGVQ